MPRTNHTEADERALLVLMREARRATEASERVRLVVRAMAQRHGIRDYSDDEAAA